ncbi:MAG: xanthine dehydrogenase family protein molybdopterin-binding subunit [Abditibacteriales bacterium]|nr:xanthine dehydrogenase family protein molybdopterin-binding subunit [Abditibacteriales bacterium]MDW8365312.1 xanthine dehydrogenase family protein molybdopterin-binding subunit [Abditibacteriales bacterium]
MSVYKVIGKPVPRIDAREKVTGAAKYSADINLPGQLWGKFLRSPYSHARIKRIDTSKAEKLPGVRAVITAATLGGASAETEDTVHGFKVSQELFASDKVYYQGEKIAAVAAEDPGIAEDAIDLIEVEYEPLPAVFDVMEAIKPDAPRVRDDAKEVDALMPDGTTQRIYNIVQEQHFNFGDVEQGFKESDLVVEDWFHIPRVHQMYLEPHAVLAVVEPTGKVNVWTSTQSIFAMRSGIASSLGLDPADVNVIGTTIGGGFGAKFGTLLHPHAVLLAKITGRPVKIVYSREEEFLDGRPAPGLVIWLKTGAKKDGTLVARQAIAFWDAGCVGGASVGQTGRIAGWYKIPHVKWDAYGVHTNKPGTAAYRAPGAPQTTFASEVQLDKVARALGIDPVEIRLKNLAEDGDSVLGKAPLKRVAFKETLKKVAEHVGWHERTKGPNQGWGVAVGEWWNGAAPGSAVVSIQGDGKVRVFYGKVDLTGTDTACAQIAAEVLGVDYEDVRVVHGDTDSTPEVTGSGGSVVLYSVGNAVKRGAEALRQRMLALAAQQLEANVDDLVMQGRKVFVKNDPDRAMTFREIAQLAMRTPAGPLVATGTFANEPSHPVISAQIVKVEVDPETGSIKILKFDNALDVGVAINPLECEGQMEGGAVQGLAWGWMEHYKYGQDRVMNATLLDYQIPTAADLPDMKSLIVEKPSEHGPFGVKGIGEPPIAPGAAALVNAVADATGLYITELPLLPERVVMALMKGGENGRNGR